MGATTRRSGFTLIELMISTTLIVGILAAVAMTTSTASDAFEQGRRREALDSRAHRALHLITSELMEAGRVGLVPDPAPPLGSATLTYRQCEGFAGGAAVWGPLRQIQYQLDSGEVDDGLDNNGNGLVDEAVVVWIENPGLANQRQTVWCRGVREFLQGEVFNALDDNGNFLRDERGLSFELQGNVLTIRLTLEDLDADGRLLTRTVETSVRLRN